MITHERDFEAAWPPAQGLTTTLVPRQSTILPIYARTIINAPGALVWSILLDTSKYHTWNSFCPHVTIHSQPDDVPDSELSLLHLQTSFTFDVIMNPAKPNNTTPTQCRVTDTSTPEKQSSYISPHILKEDGTYGSDLERLYRIAWTTEGGFVARGLRSERFSEIIVSADGQNCEFRTWECQGGVLARAVKFTYGKTLLEKFAGWCTELKKEAEKRVEEGQEHV